MQAVLTGTDVVKNVNKNNASHAVLFEALALVIHLDMDRELLGQCLSLLGKFIAVKEPNIRYLGLENMCRVALIPDCLPTIRRHLRTILNSLKVGKAAPLVHGMQHVSLLAAPACLFPLPLLLDISLPLLPMSHLRRISTRPAHQEADISIRRRALDLLFTMCDQTNAKEIVSELLAYLREAEFGMREELALKIAILAEKFAPDLLWYVDVAMGLVETAGEYISEDIWFRVVQLVTNNRDMQVSPPPPLSLGENGWHPSSPRFRSFHCPPSLA